MPRERVITPAQQRALEREIELALKWKAAAVKVLKAIEFEVHNQSKCPRCYGWDDNPKGRGETPNRHTKQCDLAALLKEAS